MRKIELLAVKAYLRGEPFKQSNTEVKVGSEHGQVELVLHGNTIAWWAGDGHRLTLAGYNTVTTRSRLNALLEFLGTEYRIVTRNFTPYLIGKGEGIDLDPEDVIQIDRGMRPGIAGRNGLHEWGPMK